MFSLLPFGVPIDTKIWRAYTRRTMTYDEVIKHFGSQTKAARAIGVKPPSVCLWRKSGIPFERQCHIQLLTGGALRAEERRREAA